MTLVHFAVLIWLQLCGCIGGGVGFVVAGRDGGPPGMLVGLAAGMAILWIAPRALRARKRFRNRFPRCKTGRCTADEYNPAVRDGKDALVCGCGDVYLLWKDDAGAPSALDERLPDGSSRPYRIRKGDEWVPVEQARG
ncbi:hypothetical protein [Polyangium jinanense]|uniref:Uncharacterized protein n=1 Tax=Polyangium jinanense TaxID=2829994 RepID=A0A9X3X222_9BACT|nr:hypothetical protein [Polyangium jinanense]MDC3954475.1 hypothetical protein [Polyangium jinanense]MDC3980778.1 hypothetical protein [Polyangium jinanense]